MVQVLHKRGVAVDEEAAALILACQDLALLGRWLDLAVEVSSTQELFSK